MKTQNGRCAFLQAGMDQNGLGDRNRLGKRAAKEPSKEKTKLANLTRAGKGLDQISKPLPVTHRTDQEKEKENRAALQSCGRTGRAQAYKQISRKI
jgi:hypothetical protein